MKKFLSLFLVLVFCLSLVLTSCGMEGKPEPGSTTPVTTKDTNTPDVPQTDGKKTIVNEVGKAVAAANNTLKLEELMDVIAAQGTPESLLSILPKKLGVHMTNNGIPSLPGSFSAYKDGNVFAYDMGGDQLSYFVLVGNYLSFPAAGAVAENGNALMLQPLTGTLGSFLNTETLKKYLKQMELTEVTLHLPTLEESMLTESENGYYIVSNTYVEACLKAILDAIPEEVLAQNPEMAQGLAAAKTLIGGMLTNLGLKLELHPSGDQINGVKLSIDSNKDFAALVQLTPDDKITATVEILADAAGEKPEKVSVDLTLAGDTFGNGTFSLLLTETAFRFTANYTGKHSLGSTIVEVGKDEGSVSAYADQTLIADIDLDLTAIGKADATVLKTCSVLVKTDNITFVRTLNDKGTVLSEDEIKELPSDWVRDMMDCKEYYALSITSQTVAQGQTSITVSLKESETDTAKTATILLYCNTLPETFQGLDKKTADFVAVYEENMAKIKTAADAFQAYVLSEMSKEEPDPALALPYVYSVTQDTALLLSFDEDGVTMIFFEGTAADVPGANLITAIAEDGTLTVTAPGGQV